MKKKAIEYRVYVSYPARFWPDYDEKVEKIAGMYSDGSGMGFGERDLAFNYKRKYVAEKLISRLKKSRLKLKVHLEEQEE